MIQVVAGLLLLLLIAFAVSRVSGLVDPVRGRAEGMALACALALVMLALWGVAQLVLGLLAMARYG